MKQHSDQVSTAMRCRRSVKTTMRILATALMLPAVLMSGALSARDFLPIISLESDDSYNRALSVARLPESQTKANFRIQLSSPSADPVRVVFFTRNGFGFFDSDERIELLICDQYYSPWNPQERCIATPGSDFYGVSRRITFAPGETEKFVSVQILNNRFAELDQIFEATLARPENGVLPPEDAVPARRWWVVIDDDDVSPTDSVLQVQIPGAPMFDASPAYVDEGVGVVPVTVRLGPPSPNPVEVIVFTASGNAIEGQDYKGIRERLIFQPGETSKLVPLEIYDDLLEEPVESVRIRLNQPIGATIKPPHPEFGEPYIAIIDNEVLPKISFDLGQAITVNENETRVRVIVRAERRVGSSVTALVYTSSTDSAQPGRDYWGTAQEIRIEPGDFQSDAFYITLLDDDIAEPDESFQLRLVNASNATISNPVLTITVVDDDT